MKDLELIELIQNLSKSEKRAFKLSAVYQKDQSLIFLLFDHLCKLKVETLHLLEHKIKHKKLLKKLSRVKRDLYYKILDFLANYHDEYFIGDKIQKQTRIARVLLKKNLNKQAWEQLLKAKKQAQLHELYNHMIGILVLQKNIIVRTTHPNKKMEKSTEYNTELKEAFAKQKLLIEYEQLSAILSTKYREHGISKDPNEIEDYKKTLEAFPPLKFKGYRLSSYYESIRSLYFNLMGDTQNTLLCKKRLIEIHEAHPHFIKTNLERYIMLIFNLITACIDTNLWDEALFYIQKVELHINLCLPIVQMRYLPNLWNQKLSYFNYFKQYQESWKLVLIIEEQLPKFQHIIDTEGSFTNIIGNDIIATCFFVQNYPKAMDWINKTLNKKHSALRQDYYINIRFLECIALIKNDLGWLVEAKLRNLKIFLKKNNKLFSLEKWLLSFIRDLANNSNNLKQLKTIYTEALVVLKQYESDSLLLIFNYPQWIEVILEN